VWCADEGLSCFPPPAVRQDVLIRRTVTSGASSPHLYSESERLPTARNALLHGVCSNEHAAVVRDRSLSSDGWCELREYHRYPAPGGFSFVRYVQYAGPCRMGDSMYAARSPPPGWRISSVRAHTSAALVERATGESLGSFITMHSLQPARVTSPQSLPVHCVMSP